MYNAIREFELRKNSDEIGRDRETRLHRSGTFGYDTYSLYSSSSRIQLYPRNNGKLEL